MPQAIQKRKCMRIFVILVALISVTFSQVTLISPLHKVVKDIKKFKYTKYCASLSRGLNALLEYKTTCLTKGYKTIKQQTCKTFSEKKLITNRFHI